MKLPAAIAQAFQRRFGGEPAYAVRAPGRVNLIGEHTDYNDGFVLPIAIDRQVWIALRPRHDQRIVIESLKYGDVATFDVADLTREEDSWIEYVKGVAWALRDSSRALKGWEGVMAGDVPSGAGLSSSAAVELAVQKAFSVINDLPWDPLAAARCGQRVENQWIGVNSGIMDQTIVAAGVTGNALLIDCRSLTVTTVPLPAQIAVVVLDTGTRRGLVDSAYNERRRQCEEAARWFGVVALRDVDTDTFAARADELDAVVRARARHVITENERTLAAADTMQKGDVHGLGQLMNESHASLRDDFEVTNRELDVMADCAQRHDACYGARMTGAGFGGCAVAIVEERMADRFIADVAAEYERRTGLVPQAYACHAAEGASTAIV